MKKRIITGLAAVTIGAAALTGCSSTTPAPVTVDTPSSTIDTSQDLLAMQAQIVWTGMSAAEQKVSCDGYDIAPTIVESGFKDGYGESEPDVGEAWLAMETVLITECP